MARSTHFALAFWLVVFSSTPSFTKQRPSTDAGPIFTELLVSSDWTGFADVVAEDFDGDGDVDVVATSSQDGAVVYFDNLGDSPPTLAPIVIADSLSFARRLAVGDVDGDGALDLVTAWNESGLYFEIAWFENDHGSPPTFTPHTVATDPTVLGYGSGIALVDIGGDDALDIVYVDNVASVLLWYQNTGFGTSWAPHTIGTSVTSPSDLALGDVDGDGDADLFVSGSAASGITAWYQNDGARPVPTFTEVPLGIWGDRIELGDVDSDGALELLIGQPMTLFLYEFIPALEASTLIDTCGGSFGRFTLADVDGDGHVDIAQASADQLTFYLGNGVSPPGFECVSVPTSAIAAEAIVVTPIDGDLYCDALVFGSADSLFLERQTGADFIRGHCNDDAHFDIADVVHGLDALFIGSVQVVCDDACDANDDGAFDVSDAVYSLAALFSSGSPPLPPFPTCDIDPTADPLTCAGSSACQ